MKQFGDHNTLNVKNNGVFRIFTNDLYMTFDLNLHKGNVEFKSGSYKHVK